MKPKLCPKCKRTYLSIWEPYWFCVGCYWHVRRAGPPDKKEQ